MLDNAEEAQDIERIEKHEAMSLTDLVPTFVREGGKRSRMKEDLPGGQQGARWRTKWCVRRAQRRGDGEALGY